MSQSLRATLAVIVALFQSTLFLRFACNNIGFRSGIRRKRGLSILAGGILAVLLFLLEWDSLFPGAAVILPGIYLLGFAVLFLEGSIAEKLTLPLILPVTGAVGEMLAAAFWRLLLPEGENLFLEAVLANGIMLAVYSRGMMARGKAELSQAERTVLYCHLAVSLILLLLLIFCGESSSLKLRLLLGSGAVVVILWGFGFVRMLSGLHRANAQELEDSLVRQEKSSRHRVDELSFQYEQLQKARHDFKNTLQVLRSLNAERKPAQIDAYIAAYLEPARTGAGFIASENEFANAIINAKTAQARQQGIEVKLAITAGIPEKDPVDICNLLGNMFDNAMEACLQVKENPRIGLQIYNRGGETVFCMRNSIAHPVLEFNPELRSSKKDSQNHGYGTGIIREIAAKYRGFADFYEESGEFCCNVVMYLE